MQVEILENVEIVARHAAQFIAQEARSAIAQRDRFVLGVSGGTTPWRMLGILASEGLPWSKVDIVQVDERIVPDGDGDRNLTHMKVSLREALSHGLRLHAMPVEAANLPKAAGQYAQLLETIAGTPPVLDCVHLGLGNDGHTASLIPGDPVLEVVDADVALTNKYRCWPRMTLTYPILNRSRRILWVVTGSEKAEMLARLRCGDRTIPAGRIRGDTAVLFADRAAART